MKKIKLIMAILLVSSIFVMAACTKPIPAADNTGNDGNKCLLDMINPLSCKQGTVTYADENGCTHTRCKEDVGDLEGLRGSEDTQ